MNVDRILDGERLGAVRDSGLLDAPAEAFERLTRLAVTLLGVEASMISVVTADRQVFLAQVGADEPWASACEVPLPYTLCRHVVERDAPLVVDDAAAHPVLRDSPAVRDGAVRAYAGMPLRARDGQVIGTLCAVDRRPRRWSDADLAALDDLTALAADAVATRRAESARPLRDRLTGAYERAHFDRLVAEALDALPPQHRAAVLALGLDGFRLVNEALGHRAGDQVLRTVAGRLMQAVREGDAVCRLGGDEFLVYLHSVEDEADALRVAERLHRAVTAPPVELGGVEHRVAASMGVALAGDGTGAEPLVEAAIAALARAKTGQSRAERADPGRRARASSRLSMRNAVAGAHERGELTIAYQPLVDLTTGRLREAEALLRWRHPELGPVPPNEFIPAAEASGAIVTLGEWVLRRACADASAWRADEVGAGPSVAVNVAPVQLRSADFVDVVASALEDAGLPACALTIEITERTLLEDGMALRDTMGRLRGMGVGIALDDFGTGYSALGYLTRFPIDTLKLDRIFVGTLGRDRRAGALVDGLVALAGALELRTVGEGIETEGQRRALLAAGCELGQGHLLGRPADAGTVARRLADEAVLRP